MLILCQELGLLDNVPVIGQPLRTNLCRVKPVPVAADPRVSFISIQQSLSLSWC